MPSYEEGGGLTTPFGRNEFLRSLKVLLTESYTLAGATIPSQTIDGFSGQKIVQPGLVMAKITSGADSGKVGPFQTGATDGRQTLTNLVGLNLTFLPWQTKHRDVEISCVYGAVAVQAWCLELDASGAAIPLTNATADALRGAKGLQINFK